MISSKQLLPKLLNIFLTAISCLLLSNLAYSQTITTGDIAGVVKDPTDAVVPNATVSLSRADNGETRTVTSGSTGAYRFTTLRPGRYQVSATAAGLTSSPSSVTVDIGQVLALNLIVAPDSSKVVVEVSDTAPLLQNDNANLATSFNAAQLENLPAPGNDMTAYAFTAPGVTVSTGGGYGNFSAFGLPGVSNLFTTNGTDNMDPYLNLNNSGASNLTLGANELSEAVVVLNGYTGQYGRQAGANVNYVTKSGTNAFHGNAGWQYNERVMNANDWFNNATSTPRPFAVSNEWAASLGGPIVRNKLFFFVDDEGLRYVLPGGGPVYIPTQNFSNFVLGNLTANNPAAVPFYQNALKLYAGASGAPVATGVTSALDPALGCGDITSSGDPNANAALAAGFGTTQPCASTFRSAVNNLNTEWLLAARADYNISSKDQIYFRFNTDHGVQATGTDPINPAFNANSVQPSYGGQFGYTRTIGSNMVNQLLLSASYYTAIFGPPDLAAALKVFPTTFAFADGLYSNLGGDDSSYPQGRKVRQWQLVDDYSITHGAHTIKFGGNVRKNFVSTYAYGSNTSGSFSFFSMTDFLNASLDNGSNYAQAFTNIGAEDLQLYSAGLYAQDEWRVRPNLLITLAIRFDRNSNIRCNGGCFNELANQPFTQVNHSASTPYNQVIQTGLNEALPSVEPVVYAPRVGFAYTVSPKTVLRGGFGIFSDLYQALIADRLITNSPAVASFTANSGTVALNDPNSAFAIAQNSYNAFSSGFASGATVAQLSAQVPGFARPNFNTVANKLYNPKYYEWNFELQQVLSKALVMSANYVGNKGYQEINQTLSTNAYAASGFGGLPTTAPDPRFGQIRGLNNQGYSRYNGLVSSLKWRTGPFSGSFSYTWSHALDTCSNGCLTQFNLLTAPSLRSQINPLSLSALNYGSSDYDVRHSLNANYVYTVPTSYFSNRVLKGVLAHWTVAGTVFYHSGYPFSVVNSGVRSANGIRNASGISTQAFLSDYLGGTTSCTTPNTACLDSANFAGSDQTNFGNLSRNSFRGPGYFNTDLNFNRIFPFRERFKFQIGAYFFNILNHPNFDLPGNNIAGGNFGQIQSTVSAPTSAYGAFQGSAVSGRVIQTQVKLTF